MVGDDIGTSTKSLPGSPLTELSPSHPLPRPQTPGPDVVLVARGAGLACATPQLPATPNAVTIPVASRAVLVVVVGCGHVNAPTTAACGLVVVREQLVDALAGTRFKLTPFTQDPAPERVERVDLGAGGK